MARLKDLVTLEEMDVPGDALCAVVDGYDGTSNSATLVGSALNWASGSGSGVSTPIRVSALRSRVVGDIVFVHLGQYATNGYPVYEKREVVDVKELHVLDKRTSDPANPAVGQIWFRPDI